MVLLVLEDGEAFSAFRGSSKRYSADVGLKIKIKKERQYKEAKYTNTQITTGNAFREEGKVLSISS